MVLLIICLRQKLSIEVIYFVRHNKEKHQFMSLLVKGLNRETHCYVSAKIWQIA